MATDGVKIIDGDTANASTFEELTREFNDLEERMKAFKEEVFKMEELLEPNNFNSTDINH